MGGSNDPSNLIELSVEEHAEAHRKLYEELGNWQDLIAWKTLSGQINSDDARKLASIVTWTGRKHSDISIQKIKEARKKQVISKETRIKMSQTRKGRKLTWDTKNLTPEANEKRSKALKDISKPKFQCPHCGRTGGNPAMKRWHFDNCKEKK